MPLIVSMKRLREWLEMSLKEEVSLNFNNISHAGMEILRFTVTCLSKAATKQF